MGLKGINNKQNNMETIGGFLADAINELLTYKTPKTVKAYIEAEKLKAAIGNPPFNTPIQ